MNEEQERRMISDTGYEVKRSFWIGGKEILLAENPDADNGQNYMVCNYTRRAIFIEYSQAQTTEDYLTAVSEFSGRIEKEVVAIKAERDALGLPGELFTVEHCYPNDYSESIKDKVVVMKPEMINPEYRRGDTQLVFATDGNGARANPRGNAVYGYYLNSGEHTRIERYEILGVLKEIPDWAQKSLARIQSEMVKPTKEKEYAGNYAILERIEVGQKVFALGFCEKAPEPYGTWQGFKESKGSFDWGHYFSDYEKAHDDLHVRANKERDIIVQDKIKKPKDRDDAR
ncbi:MAG: hypothetical protein LBN43_02145 [Oscillospiraceae bacterium]|jgi:hypothetical protein|nr:hypothetical protein [Oscillospiraceae bacterium]